MEVEEDTPMLEESRKRERAEGGGVDREDEAEEVVPTELVGETGAKPKELTLNDLMEAMTRQRSDVMAAVNKGVSENRSNFQSLRADVGAARREAQEAKQMAAKATTLAHETK